MKVWCEFRSAWKTRSICCAISIRPWRKFESWPQSHRDTETQRQGDKGTRGQGDKGTRGQGDKGTRGQGDKEKGRQGDNSPCLPLSPCPLVPLSFRVSVAKQKNKERPFNLSFRRLALLGRKLGRQWRWHSASARQ